MKSVGDLHFNINFRYEEVPTGMWGRSLDGFLDALEESFVVADEE